MHFVTQQRQHPQQQQQQQQQQQSKATSVTSSSNSSLSSIASSASAAVTSSPATRLVALCKSSSQGALPKTLATAQSYFGNLRQPSSGSPRHPQQQQRHKRTVSLNSTPMIKDIDIATSTSASVNNSAADPPVAAAAMICDAQQPDTQQQQLQQQQQQLEQEQPQHECEPEEKPQGSLADRRDSTTEENSTGLTSSKLLTIQETSTLEQQQAASVLNSTTSSATAIATATPNASTTATSSSSASSSHFHAATAVASASQPLSAGLYLKTQRYELAGNNSSSSSNNSINNTGSSSNNNVLVAANNSTSSSQAGAAPSVNIQSTEQTLEEQPLLQSQCVDSNGVGTPSAVEAAAAATAASAAASSSITDSPSSRKSSTSSKGKLVASTISLNWPQSGSSSGRDEDTQSKVSEANSSTDTQTQHFIRGIAVAAAATAAVTTDNSQQQGQVSSSTTGNERPAVVRGTSRLSERAKKKSWYNVIYPNYKSRAEDFKKLFKEVPNDERLIVDYSCALQRDILVQGRLYVSQNYVCFHANIFSWETYVSIKWRDVTAITKEKTALVIPNAISIATAKEKYFFATFAARDKSFLMLFRVWQNTLMNKQFSAQEIWKYVHNCYGEELGLTTDDEDYIDPTLDAAADTETDVDFHTAIEEPLNESQVKARQSGNSSASSGGSNNAPTTRKSKTIYFFNSSKSSNLNSSANASASGSDNKASNESGKRKSNKKMKPNAKELTLSSVKPNEQTVAVTVNVPTPAASSSTSNRHSVTVSSSNNQESKKGAEKSKSTSSVPSALAAASATAIAASTAPTPAPAPALPDSKRKVGKNQRQRDVDLAFKNCEAAPTDVSDSSDSEENNIPFVATTECTSTHEGRQIVHTILPINVDTLFNFLFSKSKFLVDFHAQRKSTDLTMSEWSINEEGQKVRTVNVTVQLAASVGPKTSKVTEYQTMRECSKPGELYSIDVNSVNAGIPYAESFSVLIHFCLARTVDDHTMLSVHAQIKYKKSIWGVVKGFIEKNTWAGLEDFFGAQLHALQSETCIPPAKGKGRRPRRGTATQIRPLEEATGVCMAQAKTDTLESQLLSSTNAAAAAAAAAAAGGAGQFHGIAGGHLKQQQQQQQKLSLLQMGGGLEQAEHKFRHKGLSLFVILFMCLLLAINVILLLKLWKLEERIDLDLSRRARMPSLAALKELPNTSQDWLELLRQQELSHETELRKWHQVLQTAIELLKKTEKTLAEVMFR